MALKVVGRLDPKERKRRQALEDQYARYLHGIVEELFDVAWHKDWSWPEFAKAAGVCYSTVLKLGNRHTRYPRHMTVWKMAKALGLSYSFEYPTVLAAKLKRKAG